MAYKKRKPIESSAKRNSMANAMAGDRTFRGATIVINNAPSSTQGISNKVVSFNNIIARMWKELKLNKHI